MALKLSGPRGPRPAAIFRAHFRDRIPGTKKVETKVNAPSATFHFYFFCAQNPVAKVVSPTVPVFPQKMVLKIAPQGASGPSIPALVEDLRFIPTGVFGATGECEPV